MQKSLVFLSILAITQSGAVFGMQKASILVNTPPSSPLNLWNSPENNFLDNQTKNTGGFSFAPLLSPLNTPPSSPHKPVMTPQSSPQQSNPLYLLYLINNPIDSAPYEIKKTLNFLFRNKEISVPAVISACYKQAYRALKYATKKFPQSIILEEQKSKVRNKLSPNSKIKSPKEGSYGHANVAINRANHYVQH